MARKVGTGQGKGLTSVLIVAIRRRRQSGSGIGCLGDEEGGTRRGVGGGSVLQLLYGDAMVSVGIALGCHGHGSLELGREVKRLESMVAVVESK